MEGRSQALCWAERVQLKVSCEYIRRYRDSMGRWVTRFAIIRAVVASSALGTWATVQAYPMLWGGIIAAAQVADAVQNVLPLSTRHRGTIAFAVALDALLIDCLMEWEDIFLGRIDEADIAKRRHKIMKLQHEAEVNSLPGGLPLRQDLFTLAEADAATYFHNVYGMGTPR